MDCTRCGSPFEPKEWQIRLYKYHCPQCKRETRKTPMPWDEIDRRFEKPIPGRTGPTRIPGPSERSYPGSTWPELAAACRLYDIRGSVVAWR